MRHIKRSRFHEQTKIAINSYYSEDYESKIIQAQINEMWKERERQEQEEAARIKKEIDRAWEEYYAKNSGYDFDAEESESYEEDEPEMIEPLYKKSKKRSDRRRSTVRANRRLSRKTENAKKNLKKRYEDDMNNFLFHSSEEIKLRAERCNALQKRVKPLQR